VSEGSERVREFSLELVGVARVVRFHSEFTSFTTLFATVSVTITVSASEH
jgi:hypothetical protein